MRWNLYSHNVFIMYLLKTILVLKVFYVCLFTYNSLIDLYLRACNFCNLIQIYYDIEYFLFEYVVVLYYSEKSKILIKNGIIGWFSLVNFIK